MDAKLILPAGIQTFEKLRNMNCVYVDKTKYLVGLIDSGGAYFLSRPRRFGKSLTVTTFESLFLGDKKLFKGLYAEEFLNRPDFKPSPVIRLDMSKTTTSKGFDKIELSLQLDTLSVAKELDVEIQKDIPSDKMFSELIINTSKKYSSKVVILIDEYDAPYTNFIDDPNMANKVRDLLRDYYSMIKANDNYIRFVFIIGISKFTKMGVFSSLNNLVDISLREEYITLCGYTEEEIIKYFPDYLEIAANKFGISIDELIEKMRKYYNGFSFDGITKLYNPFSTLEFLGEKNFFSFWIDTGSTSMIAKYLKNKKLTVEEFRNFKISMDFAKSPGEIETTPPHGFLYQAGYLSLRKDENDNFSLDYPNTEVLNSMSRLFSQNILLDNKDDFTYCRSDLLDALDSNDYELIVEVFNRLLASIPYDDFEGAAKRNVRKNKYGYTAKEWMYRSVILSFLRGCGVVVFAEMHTNLELPDLVLSYCNKIWVIELKVATKNEKPKTKIEEAMRQIKDKNYAKPYPEAICFAMAIDDEKRQIGEWRAES